MLRALADAENTRRRAEREREENRQYAVTSFARDMLNVADNLDRALQSIPEDARAQASPQVKAVLDGVEATERQLLAALERHGVRKVETAGANSIRICIRRSPKWRAKAGPRAHRQCRADRLRDRRPPVAPCDGDGRGARRVVGSAGQRFLAGRKSRHQGVKCLFIRRFTGDFFGPACFRRKNDALSQ